MKRILLLCFLLAAAPLLQAQNYESPEVAVSSEKAKIGGKVYFMHKVLPKQTIYSIGKAYGITESDLKEANPDLKDGLKAGSILLVPVDACQSEQAKEKGSGNVRNPETLRPDDDPAPDPEEPVVNRVIEHRVRWYESLNSIARKYGVSAAELVDYNGLKTTSINSGDILLIPIKDAAPDDDGSLEPDSTPDNPSVTTEDNNEPEAPVTPVKTVRWFTADEPMLISLILPFQAGTNPSAHFLNFYSGALMAVQEQKEKGAFLVVNVFDLAQGAESILADRKFEESDLIIGPVEAATLKPFVEFSDKNGIPVVSPLDHKADSLVDTHAYLFQVPTSPDNQMRNLVASIRTQDSEPVILVTSGRPEEAAFVEAIESALQEDGTSYRKTSAGSLPGILESSARRSVRRVLIGSENKNFTTEVISSLNSLAKRNLQMEVWCSNRVRNYEMSDPDALFNIAAHTSVPYFVDYSDPKDQTFVLQYRALYSAEPEDFAFSGYDILTYFIANMMQQGSAFSEHADLHPMHLLHCDIHFLRDEKESGWRNHATRHLFYQKEDYAIVIRK